jgi:uncharacterized membrane protein
MGTADGREQAPEPRLGPDDQAWFTSRVRLQAFSDGVIAIAITLTVLSIDVPTGLSSANVGHAIAGLLPDVLTYLLSFAVVGLFWLGHHVIVDRVIRVDRSLLTLNLGFLATISLVPVVTELTNRGSLTSLAVVCYATVMAVAATSELAMWVHADRAGLVDEAVTRDERSDRLFRLHGGRGLRALDPDRVRLADRGRAVLDRDPVAPAVPSDQAPTPVPRAELTASIRSPAASAEGARPGSESS